jgi:hypothetical protein
MPLAHALASCLILASYNYQVPAAVLVGIYKVEGGRVGQEVRNTNGSYDLGPMQINTIWMKELAQYWNVPQSTAKRLVRDDACTNMGVAAWILRRHYQETGNLASAIAHYHSRTPLHGHKYRRKVILAMQKNGLLKPGDAPPAPKLAER